MVAVNQFMFDEANELRYCLGMAPPHLTALERAIRLAGGRAALARAIEVPATTIQHWAEKGIAPAEKCHSIERETGVAKELLRPDIWPPA